MLVARGHDSTGAEEALLLQVPTAPCPLPPAPTPLPPAPCPLLPFPRPRTTVLLAPMDPGRASWPVAIVL